MDMLKIVAFKIGNEEYGFDINQVQSIERIQPITRVPNAPAFVKGVMNLRGNVTPIIDLSKKLNLVETQFTESTRIIMTRLEEIELGWIVDKTSDCLDVPQEALETVSSTVLNREYFSSIAKYEGRLIILLKLEELMKPEIT